MMIHLHLAMLCAVVSRLAHTILRIIDLLWILINEVPRQWLHLRLCVHASIVDIGVFDSVLVFLW